MNLRLIGIQKTLRGFAAAACIIDSPLSCIKLHGLVALITALNQSLRRDNQDSKRPVGRPRKETNPSKELEATTGAGQASGSTSGPAQTSDSKGINITLNIVNKSSRNVLQS